MTHQRQVPRRKTMLVILDGFGMNPSKKYNAVYEANTPRLDEYFGKYSHMAIEASGRAVGLPSGQMGNSEVGHITLGCGSIMRQSLVRISDAIEDGTFYDNSALKSAIDAAQQKQRPLHLIGLVSDGGVHSHIDHLLALVELCQKNNVQPMVHMITDGRDTAPQSALKFLEPLETRLKEAGGQIASVSGRYYSMDRDMRWDRTKKAWDAMILGDAPTSSCAKEAIESSYEKDVHDEFIEPVLIEGAELMKNDDPVVFFNFRNDRPRQMAEALAYEQFDGFDRGEFEGVFLTCLTEYDPKLLTPICYVPENPSTTLAGVISAAGLKQFHCAETEKYAHVTFFFNGGKEDTLPGEVHKVIPSPDVATYDLKPEMSCEGVADAVIEALESDNSFVLVNFANGDMVGHTAVHNAVVEGIEKMDTQVGRILDAAVVNDFSVVLTADHGNCEEYLDPYTGKPHTQHTCYPVPFLVVDPSFWVMRTGGGLSNVAPTVLQLMGLHAPRGTMEESMLLEEVGPIKQ